MMRAWLEAEVASSFASEVFPSAHRTDDVKSLEQGKPAPVRVSGEFTVAPVEYFSPRDVARHQLRQLSMAACALLPFVLLSLGLLWGFNDAVDAMAADGVLVAYPEERSTEADVLAVRGAVTAVLFTAANAGYIVGLVLVFWGVNSSITPCLRNVLAVMLLPLAALDSLPGLLPKPSRGLRVVITIAHIFQIVAFSLELGRITASTRAGNWAFASRIGPMCVFFATIWGIGRAFVASDRSEIARLAWLGVMQPLLAELSLTCYRGMAYALPNADPKLMLGSVWSFAAFLHMLSRFGVANMRTTWGMGAAVLVVAMANAWTYHRRSGFVLVPSDAGAETKLRVRSLLRVQAEVGDYFAVGVIGVTQLMFRSGTDRLAPAPLPILGALLAQLLVVALPDLLGALAASALGEARTAAYSDEFRARKKRLRQLPRWYVAYVVASLTITGLTTTKFMYDPVAGDQGWGCAWSKGGASGLWHRVPCGLAKEWLGL